MVVDERSPHGIEFSAVEQEFLAQMLGSRRASVTNCAAAHWIRRQRSREGLGLCESAPMHAQILKQLLRFQLTGLVSLRPCHQMRCTESAIPLASAVSEHVPRQSRSLRAWKGLARSS